MIRNDDADFGKFKSHELTSGTSNVKLERDVEQSNEIRSENELNDRVEATAN